MSTGPNILGADFDDSNVTGDKVTFDVPDDEWWLFHEIRLQRSNSTLTNHLDIEGYDTESLISLGVRGSGDDHATIAHTSAIDDVLHGSSPTFDVRAVLRPEGTYDWTDTHIFTSTYDFGTDHGVSFRTSGDNMVIAYHAADGTQRFLASDQTLSNSTDQSVRAVRMTVTENATPEMEITFYEKSTTAEDAYADIHDHSGWTQVGSVITDANLGIADGSEDFHIGVRADDDNAFADSQVYAVALYDDIGGGNLVVDVLFDDASEGASSFTERAQNLTVTAQNDAEIGVYAELLWRREIATSETTDWDGDSRIFEDNPVLVASPGTRLDLVNSHNDVTSNDWYVVQLLGVAIDPSNHKIISERTIADDVTSTFTTPAGTHWLFPHLMGQGPNFSDTNQVQFEVNHPGGSTVDQIGYSLNDMRGGDPELGYAHQPHCRSFYDGMHLDVEYTSATLPRERYEWFLIGKEVT